MIRKNLINCNLIREDISAKSHFDSSVQSFRPDLESCPLCKAKGALVPHAYYERFIIDFHDNRRREDCIKIPRFICSSCMHTHALLPDPIIPYKQYTLLFIIRVLSLRYLHVLTIDSICKNYGVTPATFQRFVKLYEGHRQEWEGLLLSSSRKIKDSLLDLVSRNPYAVFAIDFFKSTGISFLQSHKNPSHSKRKEKIPDSVFHPPHDLGMVGTRPARYDDFIGGKSS